jgi:hypothetical protein
MGNSLSEPKKFDYRYRYWYPHKTNDKFTSDELKKSGYTNIIYTDNFDKGEIIRKSFDKFCNFTNDSLSCKELNYISEMIDFCENSDKETFEKMDCLCGQNLNLCIVKNNKKENSQSEYYYAEYVNKNYPNGCSRNGRIFLRLYKN